jgi:hypothetical protein
MSSYRRQKHVLSLWKRYHYEQEVPNAPHEACSPASQISSLLEVSVLLFSFFFIFMKT